MRSLSWEKNAFPNTWGHIAISNVKLKHDQHNVLASLRYRCPPSTVILQDTSRKRLAYISLPLYIAPRFEERSLHLRTTNRAAFAFDTNQKTKESLTLTAVLTSQIFLVHGLMDVAICADENKLRIFWLLRIHLNNMTLMALRIA